MLIEVKYKEETCKNIQAALYSIVSKSSHMENSLLHKALPCNPYVRKCKDLPPRILSILLLYAYINVFHLDPWLYSGVGKLFMY